MPAGLSHPPRELAGLPDDLQTPGNHSTLFVLVHGLSPASRKEPECHLSLGTSQSCQWELVIDLANALLTVAQVAIGLAGFSSILVALSGKPHQWTPVDAFRIRNILAFTFQSVFLSLIPFVLSFFSLPPSTVWQASLLILVVATVADVLLILAGVYRLSASERAVLKTLVVSTVTVTLCIAAVVELIAVFGAIGPASGVFFLGLVVLLAVSTVLVARFLFARPAD